MTSQSIKNLGKSFKYAACGFAYVFKNERNFRIQVVAAVLVMALMIAFPLRTLERIALLLIITFILVLELINTIMEKIEEFPEMKGRTGELDILRSIVEDLNQKKLEIDKEHLMNYFTPFAMRLMPGI